MSNVDFDLILSVEISFFKAKSHVEISFFESFLDVENVVFDLKIDVKNLFLSHFLVSTLSFKAKS